MNTRLCALALLGLSLAALARAETYREPFSETHPLAPGGEIRLDNTNGAVEISTWDRDEVAISGEKTSHDPDELKEVQVQVDATPSRIAIQAILPKHGLLGFMHWGDSSGVRFKLQVPAGARLAGIHTTNGNISIENCGGPVAASTVNGSVKATGIRGDTTLSTVNGSVSAEFAAVPANGRLGFRTVNGSIRVGLPKDASATIQASTVNGRVNCGFPVQVDNSSRSHLDGTIGGGSASVAAHTVNGGIDFQAL